MKCEVCDYYDANEVMVYKTEILNLSMVVMCDYCFHEILEMKNETVQGVLYNQGYCQAIGNGYTGWSYHHWYILVYTVCMGSVIGVSDLTYPGSMGDVRRYQTVIKNMPYELDIVRGA